MRRFLVTLAVAAVVLGCSGPSTTPTASPSRSGSPVHEPTDPGAPTPTSASPTSTARPTGLPATQSPPATETPQTTPQASPTESIGLQRVASGFGSLVLLTHAPGEPDHVYLVEQEGRIQQGTRDGDFSEQLFLDLTDRVRAGGERGLLGLAFHPDYADNGRLFVNYTDRNGTTTVSEFLRQEGCGCADPASERVLLTIEQPFANHNGGMLAFGPDAYLYISTGDGGGGGDPLEAGQDVTTLLGKILRIDVDAATDELPYGIPAGNPFAAGEDGARREIWDWGLRNPWRMSFDAATGDLFIGDVGQGTWEEIDAEPAGSGGRNYGWDVMEGPDCFEPAQGCDQNGLTLPVSWYPRAQGNCAVAGGYVYRGSEVGGLQGTYLFSDYCSGTVWGIDAAAAVAGQTQEPRVLAQSGARVTGFGEDGAGEVYLVTFDGAVLRVVSATPR